MKIKLPGDKSISHRALIFSALAKGKSDIQNLSPSLDVQSTISVLRKLGISIQCESSVTVMGCNKHFPQEPLEDLDCGNAGTLMRLMMGVLVGQNFSSCLVGDESLMKRPMDRVSVPLQKLGAKISLNKTAPVRIAPSPLMGGEVYLDIASAQVKSALLLAGLYVPIRGLVLKGKIQSRDHTEKMFQSMGVDLTIGEEEIYLPPNSSLAARSFVVPNDISAAAFWIVFALMSSQRIELDNVLISPSRMGIVNVLKRSGAIIEIEKNEHASEPSGIITVIPSQVKPFVVDSSEVASLVDEIPILCLLASQLRGTSVIRGAGELRFKESDRLVSTEQALASMGIQIHINGDDIVIEGPQKIESGTVNTFNDHRIAMMAGIASCFASGKMEILDKKIANISDPYFFENLNKIRG